MKLPMTGVASLGVGPRVVPGLTDGGTSARRDEGYEEDPAEPMIIVQISDTHIETASATASSRLGDLERTVEAINALSPRPVAVLHTGDVSHDASPGDYAAARGVLGRLACPVYAIVGNRDRRLAFNVAFGPDGYLEHGSGFVQYAVDIGPVRLVAADTLDDTSALGGFLRGAGGRVDAAAGRSQGQAGIGVPASSAGGAAGSQGTGGAVQGRGGSGGPDALHRGTAGRDRRGGGPCASRAHGA